MEEADHLVKLPASVTLRDASMLAVNPPTAYCMLRHVVPVKSGEWIIQNAANSGVGINVIQVAKRLGFKTVNVVRRAELIAPLKALGADVVVTDEIPLSKQIKELVGAAGRIPLALNAVGGNSARELAKCVSGGGTMVTYGAMSRQPVEIPNSLLIFKDVRFIGFHMGRWMASATEQQVAAVWSELLEMAAAGELSVPVERVYPLSQAQEAVAHAYQGGRNGKVLFGMSVPEGE